VAHIAFKVNERSQAVDTDPDTPLLYVLRDDLGAWTEVRVWTRSVRRLHFLGLRPHLPRLIQCPMTATYPSKRERLENREQTASARAAQKLNIRTASP
jgi:hypothetical protein